FEVGEPATGQPLLAQLGLLGVDEHIDLELPPLPLTRLIVAQRTRVPRPRTPLLSLCHPLSGVCHHTRRRVVDLSHSPAPFSPWVHPHPCDTGSSATRLTRM